MKMLIKTINAQLRFDLEKEFSRISNHCTARFFQSQTNNLCNDVFNHIAVNIRQSKIPSGVTIRQLFMIEP